MKKIIIGIVAVLLVAGVAYAAKVKTINMISTKLDTVTFQIRYNPAGEAVGVSMSATAVIYDDAGEAIGRHGENASWSDIPAARKAEARSFLQWVSGVINNKAVDENIQQEIPE